MFTRHHMRPWIRTLSGQRCWPFVPFIGEIRLGEIAHGCARCPRFHQQTRRFYSSAQHAVLVARWLEQYIERPEMGLQPDLPLYGLLHDATDFILPDIASPIKSLLYVHQSNGTTEPFATAEKRLLSLILNAFGLHLPLDPCVHEADLRVLATEARDLMGGPADWPAIRGVQPLDTRIRPWSIATAERRFLGAFESYTALASAEPSVEPAP